MGASNIFRAGISLRKALLADSKLCAMTDRIFPVVTEVSQKLPFLTYFRSGLDEEYVKTGRGPESAYFQIQIYTETWEEGLRIVERVHDVLDGYTDEVIRSCRCTDSPENHDPTIPAYVQLIIFKVKTK